MARWSLGPGNLNGSIGYQRAFGKESEGKIVHPSDSLLYALGYNFDLGSFNLTIEAVGNETFASSTDVTPEAVPESSQVTIGPGLTWLPFRGTEIRTSFQFPLLRQGNLPLSQAYYGLFQLSQTF